jgi:hypothetical protein
MYIRLIAIPLLQRLRSGLGSVGGVFPKISENALRVVETPLDERYGDLTLFQTRAAVRIVWIKSAFVITSPSASTRYDE